MIKWAAIVLFFFCLSSLYAQEQLSGKVLNNRTAEPLSNVIITLNAGDSIVGFTKSNSEGEFKLQLQSQKKDGLRIAFRKNGFETLEEPLELEKSIFYLIPKQKELEFLEEVVVNTERSYLRTKNDTTTFLADSLRINSVTTLEDLIGNIPGMSIESTGAIKYRNQEISTILVGGDNITDRNYQLISKNLTQKAARAIQIIEGYTENETLKNFERSEKVAINLQLEDAYKNNVNGNIKAGYGIEERYDSQLNLFSFSEKIKTVNLAAYNNVGNFSLGNTVSSRNIQKNTKPILNFNELEDIHLEAFMARTVGFGLFNTRNVLQNNDFSLSSNQLYKFRDNSEARLNATYYNDCLSFVSKQLLTPLNINGFALENSQDVTQKLKNVDVKLQFKKLFNINEELQITGNFKNRNSYTLENGKRNAEEIDILSSVKKPEVYLAVDYSKKISSKSALVLFINSTVAGLKENDCISSDQFIDLPGANLYETNLAHQKIDYSSLKNNLGVNYAHKFTTNSILTSALLYSFYSLNSQNAYAIEVEEENLELFNEEYEQQVQFLAPQFQWAYFAKDKRFTILGKLNYILNGLPGKSFQKVELTPAINYDYKKKTKNFNTFQYNLGIQRNLVFYDFFNRSTNPVQRSVNEFYINNNEDNLYFISNRLAISSLYSINDKNIELNLSSSYDFGEKPLINNLKFLENYYIREVLEEENSFRNFIFDLDFEKFFSVISTNIEISPRYTKNYWKSLLDNTKYANVSDNYQLKFGAGSAFSSFFNYSAGLVLTHSLIKQEAENDDVSESDIESTLAYFNFSLNFLEDKLKIKLENEYINYDRTSDFLYASLSAQYKPDNSNFDFSLNLKNMFNNSAYYSRKQTLNYIQEKQLSVIPRIFIVGITYYLNNPD